MDKKSFEFLNKICFERTGGSENELKVANLLMAECRKYQVEAHLEEFEIDAYDIKKVQLETLDDQYEVRGVGMSGSTPIEGIVGDLWVYESDEQLEQQRNLEGKIVLIAGKMRYPLYQKLCEKKAIGFIISSGSLYDLKEETDLEEVMLRKRHYQYGKIPGVCLRMKDTQRLIASNTKEVKLTLLQEEYKARSHNVVATIPGQSKETIAFTAHYDSVRFSSGAYDNATGTTTLLELLSHYASTHPKRTLKFIWCGSEEMGLLGSKAYIQAHSDELQDYVFAINVDMTGVVIGKDIACCTASSSLVHYIQYLGREKGFAIEAKQGVYSSDSTPFADSGIPAVSFARIAPKGGAEIHSRKDVLQFLDQANYYRTCDFIGCFADRLIESVYFPVERTIPEEMKKELNVYYGRKEE